MNSKEIFKIIGVIVGLILVLVGGAIDLTGVGLPEGLGADGLGVLIILSSLGFL